MSRFEGSVFPKHLTRISEETNGLTRGGEQRFMDSDAGDRSCKTLESTKFEGRRDAEDHDSLEWDWLCRVFSSRPETVRPTPQVRTIRP
jgi:hypothetical protein